MKTGAFRAKRWISLGLLLVMVLSFAAPAFAEPATWVKEITIKTNPSKMTYEIGESFDPAGMVVQARVYSNVGKPTIKYLTIKHADLQESMSRLGHGGAATKAAEAVLSLFE